MRDHRKNFTVVYWLVDSGKKDFLWRCSPMGSETFSTNVFLVSRSVRKRTNVDLTKVYQIICKILVSLTSLKFRVVSEFWKFTRPRIGSLKQIERNHGYNQFKVDFEVNGNRTQKTHSVRGVTAYDTLVKVIDDRSCNNKYFFGRSSIDPAAPDAVRRRRCQFVTKMLHLA